MSTLLNKSYLVKVSTKGGGGVKNAPNSVYVVCTQPLTIIPIPKVVYVNRSLGSVPVKAFVTYHDISYFEIEMLRIHFSLK